MAISNCKNCELYKTKTKDVPGAGNKKADVVFIGEAPGKQEDMEGVPFVGAAGRFLTEMIEEVGLTRDNVFIANVLKHRPPNNRDPLPDEIEACWPYLKKQLEIINPKLKRKYGLCPHFFCPLSTYYTRTVLAKSTASVASLP